MVYKKQILIALLAVFLHPAELVNRKLGIEEVKHSFSVKVTVLQ